MPRRRLPRSLVKNSKGQGCLLVILLIAASLLSFVFRGFQPSTSNSLTDTSTSRQAITFSEVTGPRVVLPTVTSITEAASLIVLIPTATPAEISSQTQPVTSGVWGVVTASVLNVRETPDATATIVGTLSAGECIELVSEGEGWYAVATGSLGGWSSSDYITPVGACPTVAEVAEVVASATTEVVPTESPPVNNTMPSYVGQPFVPNATVARDGWLYECFGQGNNGLRTVGAGTPVQLLGVGEFVPSAEQQAMMGNGPFYKVRIWDGQFGWLPSSLMYLDPLAYASVPGGCAEYDTIDWTTVVRAEPTTAPLPEWTQVVATPTSTSPSWTPNSNPQPSRSCCKVCSTGKACGDSCISRSYTCHKGAGCACNG